MGNANEVCAAPCNADEQLPRDMKCVDASRPFGLPDLEAMSPFPDKAEAVVLLVRCDSSNNCLESGGERLKISKGNRAEYDGAWLDCIGALLYRCISHNHLSAFSNLRRQAKMMMMMMMMMFITNQTTHADKHNEETRKLI